MKLNDQVILISGASKGIGAQAALRLAQRGAHVILAARSTDLLAMQVKKINEHGLRASMVELDVTDPQSISAALAIVLNDYGRIDVLINNAGNGGPLRYLVDTEASSTRSMFDVHLFGCERMLRAILPVMMQAGRGRIVNVVSTVGYVPMPGAAAYCAAKAAIIALTEALRGEIAHTPIELVLFSPPHTQTEAGQTWPLDLPKRFTPDDAARALVATLEKDRRDWLAGGNQALLWLQRLSPHWARRIMRKLGVRATQRALAPR